MYSKTESASGLNNRFKTEYIYRFCVTKVDGRWEVSTRDSTVKLKSAQYLNV
jgi:hypothetical protein